MHSGELFFFSLFLPCLFAITLIADGASKILRNESGWISIGLGIVFISSSIAAYFVFLK